MNIWRVFINEESDVTLMLKNPDDEEKVFTGAPFSRTWKSPEATLTPGTPGDFVPAPFWGAVLVCSETAASCIVPTLGAEIETLRLKSSDGHSSAEQYVVLNVLNVIDCLDKDQSEWDDWESGQAQHVETFVFHESMLEGVHLFKIPEFASQQIYATDAFQILLEKSGLTGLSLRLLNTAPQLQQVIAVAVSAPERAPKPSSAAPSRWTKSAEMAAPANAVTHDSPTTNAVEIFQMPQQTEIPTISAWQELTTLAPTYKSDDTDFLSADPDDSELDHVISTETDGKKPLIHEADAVAMYYREGLEFTRTGQPQRAIDKFMAALALAPDHASARYNLGWALFLNGNIVESIPELRKAVTLDPQSADPYCALGIALMESGQFAGAAVELENALKINPNHAEAHFQTGYFYLKQNRPEDAAHEYREALRLDPFHNDAHYRLGNYYFDSRAWPDAISEYQAALAGDPSQPNALVNLGCALINSGRLPEGIKALKDAVALNPENAFAQHRLGNALYKTGARAEALKAFREAVRLGPDVAKYHYNLGVTQVKLGSFPEAQRSLLRVLRLDNGEWASKARTVLSTIGQETPAGSL